MNSKQQNTVLINANNETEGYIRETFCGNKVH